jgi:serpin B
LLACDLYGRLRDRSDSNLFFSPFSIATVLAMTLGGARGRTAEQMAGVLHVGDSGDVLNAEFRELLALLGRLGTFPTVELSIANALWGQQGYGFLDEFLELLQVSYGSALREVDFVRKAEEASREINGWVMEKTRGKIVDIVPPGGLGADTRLVLVNAMYFQCEWSQKFDLGLTRDEPFFLLNGDQVDVQMMSHGDPLGYPELGYLESDEAQTLEMPYRAPFSMIVVLPKNRDGLAAMEKKVVEGGLGLFERARQWREVEVIFPRFRIEDRFELGDMLGVMGMPQAFDEHRADFSRIATRESMARDGNLFISDVIHQAFVVVDEHGTEAAAATTVQALGAALCNEPEKPPVFRADHPFLFAITAKKTGTILFLGRVTDPGR